MSKYIIEIEDEPFVRQSALYGEEGLYRANGFKSLVFDKDGLDKLTPLDKALEEAYQNGYDEAQLIYQNPHAESDYQKGLNTAWDMARKIVTWPDRSLVNSDTFDLDPGENIFTKYPASRAIEKLKAYEEQQKADEIKVGDEVRSNNAISDHTGVVLALSLEGNSAKVLENDGSMAWVAVNVLTKTGRHFNFLASLLNAMKEGVE